MQQVIQIFHVLLQVCLEGEISKSTIMNSLSQGKRASGDLIPWTVSQQVGAHLLIILVLKIDLLKSDRLS